MVPDSVHYTEIRLMVKIKFTKYLYRKLEAIVGPENISDDDIDRICHSYDATKQRALPDVVISPTSPEMVSKVLMVANEHLIPVYPMGAASGLTGGALPLYGGIVLDMTKMNRILEIDESDLVATVEPGVVISDLQEEVEKRGLFYPPDPASSKFATMGGSVAECSGGLRGMKYGVTKDYVLALEVVLPTGEIIHTGSRTLKSVTGYDLTKLFVGSEGTLGVFTKITVKLIPLPESVETLRAYFRSIASAADTVSAIISAKIVPRTLEFVDEECLRAVNVYSGLSVPEETKAMLLIETDGSAETAAKEAQKIIEICNEHNAFEVSKAQVEDEKDQLWAIRRMISPALYAISKGKINEDICVPRGNLTKMLSFINEVSTRYGLRIANFGHAGDGNIHVNILIDPGIEDEQRRAERAVEEIFREVVSLGGTLSGEHGIGITKSKYLNIEVGDRELKLMRDIKRLLDPNNILNPGKIFHDQIL